MKFVQVNQTIDKRETLSRGRCAAICITLGNTIESSKQCKEFSSVLYNGRFVYWVHYNAAINPNRKFPVEFV